MKNYISKFKIKRFILKLCFYVSPILFSCLILSPFAKNVHAQTTFPVQALRVSPVIIDINLQPGQNITKNIKIDNLSPNPVPIELNIDSFEPDDEDGGYNLNTVQTSQLSQWITINQPNLILNPDESRQIEIAISIPKQVDIGSYFAMIFLTPVVRAGQIQAPVVQSRIGIIVMGSVGVAADDDARVGSILTFRFANKLIDNQLLSFLIRVKNNSLFHFSAKPKLTLTPVWGQPVTIEIPEKTVFPGKIRRWEQEYRQQIPPNLYTARLTVSLGSGRIVDGYSYVFVGPWKTILAVLLFIFIFTITIVKRRNISQAISELIK